jgi:hypothetical protein
MSLLVEETEQRYTKENQEVAIVKTRAGKTFSKSKIQALH